MADDAITVSKLVSSICQWGMEHEGQIKELTNEEARRLVRMFGHLVDEFVEEAEASERALLADLLEDVEI